MHKPIIAVLIPCYNEEQTIKNVVTNFRAALPDANIYVYDNNSSDNTKEVARANGAIVNTEHMQGKGHVVRRMFADIEADAYLLVDGDDTYDATSAKVMVNKLLDEQLDMVTGIRKHEDDAAYRTGHQLGNKMITGTVKSIFGNQITDLLSGYRVFSKRFVKSFPVFAKGFEIETEFSVHALELSLPIAEIETKYFARPEGSVSKLSTYKDGFKILRMILRLVREHRPRFFFGIFAVLFALLSVGLAEPIIADYLQTGLVPRLPTAVLSAALMILGFIMMAIGIILDPIARFRKEAKKLAYLRVDS